MGACVDKQENDNVRQIFIQAPKRQQPLQKLMNVNIIIDQPSPEDILWEQQMQSEHSEINTLNQNITLCREDQSQQKQILRKASTKVFSDQITRVLSKSSSNDNNQLIHQVSQKCQNQLNDNGSNNSSNNRISPLRLKDMKAFQYLMKNKQKKAIQSPRFQSESQQINRQMMENQLTFKGRLCL